MTFEKSIFFLEYKRYTRRRGLLMIFTLFALLLIMMQIELNNWKSTATQIEEAGNIEITKSRQFKKWSSYGVHGVVLTSIPSSLSFLSAFNIYGNLSAQIDSEINLRIFETKKDRIVLPDPANGYLNFSGLILVVGGLLALMYGASTFKNEKDLRLLCGIKSFPVVFWKTLLAGMFLLSMTVLLFMLGTVLLAFLNGIDIMDGPYLYYFLQVFLLLNVCLAAGTTFGSMRKRSIGTSLLIGLFIINVLSPWFIYVISSGFSNNYSERQVELGKLKILMAFENRGVEKFGGDRTGDEVKNFIKGFYENELILIEEIETKHKNEILETQGHYQALSIIFPGSFFLENALEVSGQGFNNYSRFYTFAEKEKHRFIKFYADKKYLSKNAPEKVQSFVVGNSNIFYFKPGLPANRLTGTILNLLYTFVFVLLTYRNTLRKVHPKTRNIEDEEDVYIPIEPGKTTLFFTTCPILKNKIYNDLIGREKIKGQIELFFDNNIENLDITDTAFISGEQMQYISAHALHRFFFGEKPAKNMNHWDVLFKYALTRKIVIFDEFLKTRPDKLDDFTLQLKEHNTAALLISSDYYFTEHFVDETTPFEYYVDEPLAGTLKKLKEYLRKQGGISNEKKENN